jgi:hypothetical protein
MRLRNYGLRDLSQMKRLRRIGTKFPLSKQEARAVCTAACALVPPTRVPELPPRQRFRTWWRAYHDYTRK